MHLRSTLLAIALLGAGVPTVSASTIVYFDLSSFQTDTVTTNIDFSGIVPDGGVAPGPFAIGNVTFSGPLMYVVDADYGCCAFPNSMAPASLFDDDQGPGVAYHVAFGAAVTAVGFDIADAFHSSYPNSGTISVALSNGFMTSFASTGLFNFVGFASDTPISFLDISSSDNLSSGYNYTELTNFRSGDATIPEPASLVLLGTGLAGAGVRRLRRRKNTPA